MLRVYGPSDDDQENSPQEIRIEEKISSTIELAQAPEPMIRLKNAYKLFRIYFVCLTFIVLWNEIIHSSLRKSDVTKVKLHRHRK